MDVAKRNRYIIPKKITPDIIMGGFWDRFKKAGLIAALLPSSGRSAGINLHKGGRNTKTRVVRLRKGEVIVKRKGATGKKRKGKKPGPKTRKK